MYTIKIMNEFLHGPIWVYNEDGIVVRGFPLIDNDKELCQLNEDAGNMYSSYFEFDSHEKPCWFDSEKEKQQSETMKKVIEKILSRLTAINDGSFVVEDYVTPHLEQL